MFKKLRKVKKDNENMYEINSKIMKICNDYVFFRGLHAVPVGPVPGPVPGPVHGSVCCPWPGLLSGLSTLALVAEKKSNLDRSLKSDDISK